MVGEITVETIARAWRDDVAASRAFARGADYVRQSDVSFNALMAFVADEVLGPEPCAYSYRIWHQGGDGVTIESRCLTHPDEEPQRRRVGMRGAWELGSPIDGGEG